MRPPNAAQIQGLQPNGASYKKADDRGLYLLIKPNGSKLWHFKYRFASKEKKMPLGQWPNVTLAKARLLRDSARAKVIDGIDPMMERKRQKLTSKESAANTFESVALEYIQEKMIRQGLADATLRKARWFLSLLKPAIGNMPISDVDPQMILAPLKRLEARGNLESAKKCRSFASRVFRYGAARSQRTNLVEAQRFMSGEKHILIFSDAGGTGRSYHASYDVQNQQRRVHFLLEPGWRADKAIQGLARAANIAPGSSVVVSEVNVFDWPGFDIRPLTSKAGWVFGRMTPGFFNKIITELESRRPRVVHRS